MLIGPSLFVLKRALSGSLLQVLIYIIEYFTLISSNQYKLGLSMSVVI